MPEIKQPTSKCPPAGNKMKNDFYNCCLPTIGAKRAYGGRLGVIGNKKTSPGKVAYDKHLLFAFAYFPAPK